MMIPASIAASIEQLLGRPLDPAAEGKITDLNELPLAMVEEARRLPRIERREYLTFHTSLDCRDYLVFFISQVVQGKQDPASWMKGAEYEADFAIGDLLTLDRAALLGAFGPGLSTRRAPCLLDWQGGQPVGAPARWMPEKRYFSRSPEGVISCVPGTITLETFEDLAVALRRWIACRFAWVLPHHQLTLRDEGALAALLPPGLQASEDAASAVQAAIREEHELGPAGPSDIPGFRGPDDWYR